MSERDKPFSVSDRRHFTPEGRARDENAEAETVETAAADTGAARAETPPAPADTSTGTSGQSPGERTRSRRPVDFGSFLLSLGAQAGVLLSGGALGDAEGEDAAAALEGARQIIEILEMLQDKTQGRRTEQETRVLEDLLFQLRLAYVERSRGGKA